MRWLIVTVAAGAVGYLVQATAAHFGLHGVGNAAAGLGSAAGVAAIIGAR